MRAPHLQRIVPARLVTAGALGIAATFAVQPLASAHVSVTPDVAEPGKPAVIAFRVPNESHTASTVRLEVTFPPDHPLAAATPQAVAGWRVTVRKQALDKSVDTGAGMAGEAVSSIVWEGGPIAPDTFQDFPVYVGAMPAQAGQLTFRALQTYSDGSVTRWIDAAEPGQPEPEHPAPAVTVAAAPVAATTQESTSDTTARVLGGTGLGFGVAALGWTWLTRRRPGLPKPIKPAPAPRREKVRL